MKLINSHLNEKDFLVVGNRKNIHLRLQRKNQMMTGIDINVKRSTIVGLQEGIS